MIAKVGDPVRLGVEIGHGMEPVLLTGRLVGRRHGARGMHANVLRAYRPGDVVGIPTGDYFHTAFLVPWMPPPGFEPGVRHLVDPHLVPDWRP